jgi:16S rRNA (uracil1498-N3)-methyltransferase
MASPTQHSSTRLYVDAELGRGAEVMLDADRAHYLRHVLRLEAGATVALFNGRVGEWQARVTDLGKKRAVLTVETQARPQEDGPDLWLAFAPIKHGPIDLIAEKATELGVALLQPVTTQRTAVTRINIARLRANAIEAAQQCERLSVPIVRDAVTLDKLLAEWPHDRCLLLCAEAGSATPIADALQPHAQAPRGNRGAWAILVGPEGGFARAELDALHKLPFVTPVGLGPRILRADTAALAALACWQAILGDGQQRPPHRSFA